MKFHSRSGLRELQLKVDYAGVFVRRSTGEPMGVPRPVKVYRFGSPVGEVVEDPLAAPGQLPIEGLRTPLDLQIVGLWSGPVYPLRLYPHDHGLGELARKGMTWQGYAAQQLGEVLRQRELAARLTAFGIPRDPEEYLPHRNVTHAVQRSLTLNYDELDRLLTAAGA